MGKNKKKQTAAQLVSELRRLEEERDNYKGGILGLIQFDSRIDKINMQLEEYGPNVKQDVFDYTVNAMLANSRTIEVKVYK